MPGPLKRQSALGRSSRGANNMDDGPAKYMILVGLGFAVFIFFWIYHIQSTKTTS
ncbi:MAG: hypothetical protein ACI90V_009367 [Bacillariaceae sp.]|jgi:hypothetical protein